MSIASKLVLIGTIADQNGHPTPPAAFVTTIAVRNMAGVTQNNSIIQHGMIFPKGTIPSGSTAVHCAHGTTTPLADSSLWALNTWSDGSVRQAVMAANIPSLGTGTVTDPRGNVIQGILLDIVRVSGSANAAGISKSTVISYLTANASTAVANWKGIDPSGTIWTADVLTAMNGASGWSKTAPSFRGAYYTGSFMDCFCCTMPLMSGATAHPALLAVFWVYVYHNGNNIQDIYVDAVLENGYLGVADSFTGINAGDYFFADLTLFQGTAQSTISWQRLAETGDKTLNIQLGRQSWLPVSTATGGYLTGGGSFNFATKHCGRILEHNGEYAYVYRTGATGFLTVDTPGSGYSAASTATNSGGTAVLQAISDPVSGGLLAVNMNDGPAASNVMYNTGTLGTVSVSGGSGASISKNTTASNVCLWPAPCISGSICRAQNGSSGTLSMNGNAVTNGVAKVSQRGGGVFLYSANNNSTVTVTISGTKHGASGPSSQAFPGPAAGRFVDCGTWDIVTSVSYSGGTPSALAVGTGGIGGGVAGVSSKGVNVTTGISWPAGSWRVLGVHIPRSNALAEASWMNGTPRNYVSFDSDYLLSTKVPLNYNINAVNKSYYASQATNNVSGSPVGMIALNNMPQGASQNAPDSKDYNPFYSIGNATVNGNVYGYQINESTSGGSPGLSSDSAYDVSWLVCQTFDSWRDTYDRARFNAMYSPIWLRDETTGMMFDPATYPALSNGSNKPPFYPNTGQASGFDGAIGGINSGFNWYNYDIGHQNTRLRLCAVMTGNAFLLDAICREGITRWMCIVQGWGLGYNRPCLPNGGTQGRVTGWLIKTMSHPAMHYNEAAPAGIMLAHSVFLTIVSNYISNPTTKMGLYEWYVSPGGNNPKGFPKSSYGDYHWMAGPADGTVSFSTTFQSNYIFSSLTNLLQNEKLSSNGIAFFRWYGQTILDNVTDSTYCNPRWIYKDGYLPYADQEAGTYYSTRAQLYAGLLQYFPSPMYDYSPGYAMQTVAATLSATSGGSVTLTSASPLFYSDMVGSYVSDKCWKVTAVQTSSPWNLTIPGNPFANGQAVQCTPAARPAAFGQRAMASPLNKWTTYYVGNKSGDDFQLFTDSGLTQRVQLTSANTGTLIFAGLGQITAVSGGTASPSKICTISISRPFISTSLGALQNDWNISHPPAGANAPAQAFMVGLQDYSTPSTYFNDVRGILGLLSEDPTLYAAAKAAWDTVNQWGLNAGWVMTDPGKTDLKVSYKYR